MQCISLKTTVNAGKYLLTFLNILNQLFIDDEIIE